MEFWIKNAGKIVYFLTTVIVILAYVFIRSGLPEQPSLQNIRLTEIYGFLSVGYLYLVLSIGPLYTVVPGLPLGNLVFKARPALGVCSFLLAALHSFIGFFKLLDGFAGLGFLTADYQLNLSLASVALLVLAAMALTSNTYSIKLLGKFWKRLHNLVFLAGVFVVIHVLALGAHFVNTGSLARQISFYALLMFLFLQGLRLQKIHAGHDAPLWRRIFILLLVPIVLVLAAVVLWPYKAEHVMLH